MLVAGLIGFGLWKVKRRANENSRRPHQLANLLRSHLHLQNVDNFDSDIGKSYLSAVNKLSEELSKLDISAEQMNNQELNHLLPFIVEAIREFTDLEQAMCFGVNIMPQELNNLAVTLALAVKQKIALEQNLEQKITLEINTIELKPVTTSETSKSPIALRKGKTRTVIKDRYALVNKIDRIEADQLYQQTEIEVNFTSEKKEKFILGRGHFGKLRLAYDLETNQFIGVKKIKNSKDNATNAIEASRNEAILQQKLAKSSNIMPLLDSVETVGANNEPVLYQFMQLAGWGNGDQLKERLLQTTDAKVKEKICVHAAKGLLTGIQNMHQLNIYHLDIKPSNIVFDKQGYLYVIDFGCALELENGLLNGGTGDSRYFSPERLANFRYHFGIKGPATETVEWMNAAKIDAWAVGVTLLEWMLGEYPFDQNNLNDKVEQWDSQYFQAKLNQIELIKNTASDSLEAVIKGLLDLNPQTRITVERALQMLIFKQAKYQFVKVSACQAAFAYLKHCNAAQESKEPIVELVPKENNTNYTHNKYSEQSEKYVERSDSNENVTISSQIIHDITYFQASNQSDNNNSVNVETSYTKRLSQ